MRVVFVAAIVFNLILGSIGYAEVSWTIKKQLNIETSPMDISSSDDGQLLFVLTSGEILVYSVAEDKIIGRISIDKSVDRLQYVAKDNSLILSSNATKKLTFIQLDISQKIDIYGSPFKGPENAPVTIVVFSDYQCPFCANVEPLIQQILNQYPKAVKSLFKNFPLSSHKFARSAATAALAARAQGKYWEFHDKVFANSKTLNDAKFQEIARELGLDIERFNKDMIDPTIQKQIDKDMADGQQAGVRGTPTIFINGKLLKNRSLEGFKWMIEAGLKK